MRLARFDHLANHEIIGGRASFDVAARGLEQEALQDAEPGAQETR
jgi:hypothetical protein